MVALTSSEWVDLALTVFLFLVGFALAFAFVLLGLTLARTTKFIDRTERKTLPVIEEAGGTVVRVNRELDKVGQVTDSAVDAAVAADRAVRAVSNAVTTPIKKVTGLVSGVTHGASSLKAHGDFREATRAGKEAAARREVHLEHDLAQAEAPETGPADAAA